MKIVTPVSAVSELKMLLHNGADELYCGLRTPEWDGIFGTGLWMNRRSPEQANLSSFKDLRTITAAAHARSVTVAVTLNAPFYPEDGIRYLLNLSGKLVDCGVDTLIVSDLNLLMALCGLQLPVRIHLSSLGSCFNSHSIEFYKSLGVNRIILPRQLTLPEIRAILEAGSADMEFEVFCLNDGCYFEEGFCQTSHSLGAFCLTNWDYRVLGDPGEQSPGEQELVDQETLEARGDHFKRYLWFQNNCGSSFQSDGLPNGPCSLCEFGNFRDWGVTAVKIVGREGSFHRKMSSLQLVKAVRDKIKQLKDHEGIRDYARGLRKTPEYCDAGYMCYFRNQ